ncbi:hypothetical protein LCGC14_2658080 [marine sediment metagenome]|uniref:Uncharacterized protein n=1 Tax=marine sediment metagenome TaxID=412755 RepID=A0A0F9AF59_9ZZZZ
MKWQDVKKYLIGSSVGIVVLFSALFLLTGFDYTYSGDIVCGETCESYINVTTTYWRICFAGYENTKYENETLFKKRSRSRTLHVNMDNVDNIISTEPRIEVDWLVPTYGKKWRPIKDGDCWDRKKINKIKLVGHKKEWQDVKWSFEVGDYVEIDPFWLSGIEVGDKVVKELCNPVNKTWTDEIPHNKICTNCYNTTNMEEIVVGTHCNATLSSGDIKVEYDNFTTSNAQLNYTYEPDTYVQSATARSLLSLTILFFALAVLIGLIGMFMIMSGNSFRDLF